MDYYWSTKRNEILISFSSSPPWQNLVNGINLISLLYIKLAKPVSFFEKSRWQFFSDVQVTRKTVNVSGVSSQIWFLSPTHCSLRPNYILNMPDRTRDKKRQWRKQTKEIKIKEHSGLFYGTAGGYISHQFIRSLPMKFVTNLQIGTINTLLKFSRKKFTISIIHTLFDGLQIANDFARVWHCKK